MGFLNKFVKLAVNTVSIPIDVAKDVVTLGGVATEQSKSYTEQRIEKLIEDTED